MLLRNGFYVNFVLTSRCQAIGRSCNFEVVPLVHSLFNVGVFNSSEVEIKLDNRPFWLNNIAVQNWFIKNWKFTTVKSILRNEVASVHYVLKTGLLFKLKWFYSWVEIPLSVTYLVFLPQYFLWKNVQHIFCQAEAKQEFALNADFNVILDEMLLQILNENIYLACILSP